MGTSLFIHNVSYNVSFRLMIIMVLSQQSNVFSKCCVVYTIIKSSIALVLAPIKTSYFVCLYFEALLIFYVSFLVRVPKYDVIKFSILHMMKNSLTHQILHESVHGARDMTAQIPN